MGIECPPEDQFQSRSGKYALAVTKRKGPVAILTTPAREDDGTTCIFFHWNIPVRFLFKIKRLCSILIE
jgi:hypothetical protein